LKQEHEFVICVLTTGMEKFNLPTPLTNELQILITDLLRNFYVRHNTSKINNQMNMMYMFSVPYVSLHLIVKACTSGANFRDRGTTSYQSLNCCDNGAYKNKEGL
jgi:hypothetical protein